MQPRTNHIFEFTPDSLADWFKERGSQPFRAQQVLEWVYQKGIIDPAAMTNLSKRDRELIADPVHGITFLAGHVAAHRIATDGTQKLLIDWSSEQRGTSHEGKQEATRITLPLAGSSSSLVPRSSSLQTECVMIPSDDRRTACVSSQVGCPVGCAFCASGIGGLDANLTAGQIVEQVWRLGQLKGGPKGEGDPLGRISNVVFMGMGEPLSNLGSVIPAIRTLNSLWATGISARKITISTVGLPKAIERLSTDLDLPVTLALSLHAPTDEIRRELIPWAEYTTIKDLLAACQKWFDKTGREITLEYTLLRGKNDQPSHATELARLAQTLRANINLIRYNEVAGLPFLRPHDDDVLAFQRTLRAKGINTHIRASRGRDIAAACGQLRHELATAGPPASGT